MDAACNATGSGALGSIGRFAGIGRLPAVSAALQLALGNAVVSLVYVLVGAFFADAERGSWLAFLAAMAVSGAFFLLRSRMVRPEK